MKPALFRRFTAALLILTTLSLAASLLAGVEWEKDTDNLLLTGDTTGANASSFRVVRAYYSDLSLVDSLSRFAAPWEVNRDKGYVVVGVDAGVFQAMQAMGFDRIEIDHELTRLALAPRVANDSGGGIPGFPCYRTVEETFQSAAGLAASNPGLAQWIDAGDSWEKTQNGASGYDVNVLVLTNQATSGPKPKLFVTSALHAREYTTAELVTRFAEYLVAGYGVDPDVTWLLDHHEIHLMLHANPDGRKRAETGLLWRKNTNNNYCTNSNSRGADLNRNFDYQWACCGGSSGAVCSDTYRGPTAGSEPETQAVQAYMQSIFPDQRGPGLGDPAPLDATGVYIDVHSYSELVLWPWGFTSSEAPNGTAMQTLGRKLAWYTGYTPQQAIELYITDGTTDDFAYGDLGIASFTYELGTTFFQDCSTFDNVIYPDNLPTLVYAAKVSRTPYMTPAGPDTLNVSAFPGVVDAGAAVTLTATLDDTLFNNSNGTEPVQSIAAAEYYVDVPYWITSTTPIPVAMAPVDGAFDSSVEGASAVIDTTGWAGGRHTLYVRGRDADGNWGAVSAAFVYVTTGNEGAFVGELRDSQSGDLLQGAVFADAVGVSALTDASGVYTLTLPAGSWDLRASALYHLDSSASGLAVSDGVLVPQDFTLDPTAGMVLGSASVTSSQALGQVVTQTLRVSNPGNLPLTFSTRERDGGYAPFVAGERVQGGSTVLLVDDDDNTPDVRNFYINALNALGIGFDVFNVGGGSQNGPDAATMAGYDVVIWFSGDNYGNGSDDAGPNAADEVELATYLDNGGALFLSSQDYHYDRGLTPFMSGYLGVAAVSDDSGDYSSLLGQNDFAAFGPYTLTEPGTDYSDDLTPGGGQTAFVGNNGNPGAVYTENTVFFAAQWEGIANNSPQNGQESLLAILDHLAPPAIEWLSISPEDGLVPAGSFIDLTLTFSATAPIVTQEGLYTGTLTLRGDDPANPVEDVLIRMYVGDAPDGIAGGTIFLQGRTDHSGATASALQGAQVVGTTLTDSAGNFTLSLPPGMYDIEVTAPGYLKEVFSTVSISSGGTASLGPATLLGGDANGDQSIDILDLSIIGASYGLGCGAAGYDPLADINGDCLANIQDLSLAAGNYGQSAP